MLKIETIDYMQNGDFPGSSDREFKQRVLRRVKRAKLDIAAALTSNIAPSEFDSLSDSESDDSDGNISEDEDFDTVFGILIRQRKLMQSIANRLEISNQPSGSGIEQHPNSSIITDFELFKGQQELFNEYLLIWMAKIEVKSKLSIQNPYQVNANAESYEDYELIQLQSIEDVDLLNNEWKDKKKQTAARRYLKRIGGKSPKNCVTLILRHLFSGDVLREYTWSRKNGTARQFCDLKNINKVIINAVKDMTKVEYKSIVLKLLKYMKSEKKTHVKKEQGILP